MNITISPKYKYLQPFIESIPRIFGSTGDIVQDRRNTIKAIEVDGLKFNIKRYRRPIFFNRVVYTFFRATKAARAYKNAGILTGKGIKTPLPIAYIEDFPGGLLDFSYFVSTQLYNVREVREYCHSKVEGNEGLFRAFARYTAELHEKNIYHLDYSPGNIMISDRDDGGYNFSLVDINRMKFIKVGIKAGCMNFARLFECDEVLEFMAVEYAGARNFDKAECIKLILEYKYKAERRRMRKEKMKKILGVD